MTIQGNSACTLAAVLALMCFMQHRTPACSCSLPCCLLPAEAEVVPVRQIDNSAVLSAQLARLASVKASRDDSAVAAALQVGSGWDRRAAVEVSL